VDDLFLQAHNEGEGLVLLDFGIMPVAEEQGFGRRRPSVYYVPFHQREDDLDEQLEDAAREAMLQQLAEARGVAAANRLYQKQIDDSRRLSLLSAQRNAAVMQDPLHRFLPKAGATAQKEIKAQRVTAPHLPPPVKDKMDGLRRDAALADAQAAAEAKRKREEEIRQTRLKNLAKARKAKRK